MTFDFGGCGAACDAALHAPSVYQVWKFLGLPIRQIPHFSAISISHPGDLETDAHYSTWSGQASYQFRCFWDFSFSTVGQHFEKQRPMASDK